MVGTVVAAAIACNIAWSPSPIGVQFHLGIWAPATPQDAARNAAIALVPKNGSVSATYDIDPHMSHRVLIYEWPNPWHIANWGLNDSYKLPDPSQVDWLVLNLVVVAPSQAPLYETLEKKEFKVVFDQDGILVLHRVAPGRPNDHDWP